MKVGLKRRQGGAQIACRWGWGSDFCNAYTAEQRHAYRLKKAPPVLQAFWKWLESLQDADPKSRLGKAYTYAKNRRPYLETYLEDGRCSLSNNAAENAIRPFCVGRRGCKNRHLSPICTRFEHHLAGVLAPLSRTEAPKPYNWFSTAKL